MEVDELWKNRSSCTPSSGCAYQGSALLTEMDKTFINSVKYFIHKRPR